MRIVPLCDCQHLAPAIAEIHGREWAHLYPGWNGKTALTEFLTHTDRAAIPATLVAFRSDDDNDWVGSVSLILNDLPGEEALNPWLASLYVRETARGSGVGALLVSEIERVAFRCGVPRMYLFTETAAPFFARLGWDTLGERTCNGHRVSLMCRDPSA